VIKNKDKRILMISPNNIGVKGGISRFMPGLGIMYLASVLEDRGFHVAIRDTAVEGYDIRTDTSIHPSLEIIGERDEAIRDYVADFKPDLVGISVLFYSQSSQGHNVAKIVKSLNPNTLVVVGGNQVSENYASIMKNKNIDYAMIDECDLVFADFVEAYFSDTDYRKIPGLVYRSNGGLEVNNNNSFIKNLDDIPLPARHLVNMEKYFEIGLSHNPYARHPRVGYVMTSRGCPEKCAFCTTPIRWGRKVRWRSIENVELELRQLRDEYKVGEIQFEDDTLTLNIKHLHKLCDTIEKLGIMWNTVNGVRIDYHAGKPQVQEDMFRRMAASGCYQVCFGLESGNQRVLDKILNKNLKLSAVEPCINAAKKAGLSVHLFLMVGFPGETLEEMERTIAYAKMLGPDSCSISIFTPLPGTPLYKYAFENNYMVGGFTEENILFAKSNIKVAGFTPEEFEKQVTLWTNELNNELKKNDPGKFHEKYKRFLDENESFTFVKHS